MQVVPVRNFDAFHPPHEQVPDNDLSRWLAGMPGRQIVVLRDLWPKMMVIRF